MSLLSKLIELLPIGPVPPPIVKPEQEKVYFIMPKRSDPPVFVFRSYQEASLYDGSSVVDSALVVDLETAKTLKKLADIIEPHVSGKS